jgi:hypothetical protein
VATDLIFVVLAGLLLPAGPVVLVIANADSRAENESGAHPLG